MRNRSGRSGSIVFNLSNSGAVANGDTIEGTFTTRGSQSVAPQTGTWRVKRGGALRTATYNPAELLGSLDFLGTIGQGNIADLVLLDADPLKDIHNTTRISAVIAMGACSIRPHWAHC